MTSHDYDTREERPDHDATIDRSDLITPPKNDCLSVTAIFVIFIVVAVILMVVQAVLR